MHAFLTVVGHHPQAALLIVALARARKQCLDHQAQALTSGSVRQLTTCQVLARFPQRIRGFGQGLRLWSVRDCMRPARLAPSTGSSG
jgi:class 3 adenylate cyclase